MHAYLWITGSGCPMGCRFCGAGDAYVKNLTGCLSSRIQFERNKKPMNATECEQLESDLSPENLTCRQNFND